MNPSVNFLYGCRVFSPHLGWCLLQCMILPSIYVILNNSSDCIVLQSTVLDNFGWFVSSLAPLLSSTVGACTCWKEARCKNMYSTVTHVTVLFQIGLLIGIDEEKLFTNNDGTVHSNSFSDTLLPEVWGILLYGSHAMMLQCDTFSNW